MTAYPKRLLLQGATGSIGQSVLSVVRAHRDRLCIVGLAAHSNGKALAELSREFGVQSLALHNKSQAQELPLAGAESRIYLGSDAATEQAQELDYDLLVNALSGGAGLEPTAAALERGIPVALANKETLVAAGPLILQLAADHHTAILPIDSEHSAIVQCLVGERSESIRKIWLTTSGGPFWGRDYEDLRHVTVEQALAHPTWKMGPKITVDSATLFNKGLEVIEAQRLFGVQSDQIGVVCHRQSVVHSMVEFCDGSSKAQLSQPDMRLPILYALSCPERWPSSVVHTDLSTLGTLTFEPVPAGRFPCLDLAFTALQKGGTTPAALSAADEVAVDAFLQRRISFHAIADVIRHVVSDWPLEPLTDLSGVREADLRARRIAEAYIGTLAHRLNQDSACY
jgi:1-deoxy-D-xylulose-5-phosphate reductoisomerase